jgi:hypothetical protein
MRLPYVFFLPAFHSCRESLLLRNRRKTLLLLERPLHPADLTRNVRKKITPGNGGPGANAGTLQQGGVSSIQCISIDRQRQRIAFPFRVQDGFAAVNFNADQGIEALPNQSFAVHQLVFQDGYQLRQKFFARGVVKNGNRSILQDDDRFHN